MKKKSAVLGMAAAAALSGGSFSALAGPCTTAKLSTYFSGGVNAGCTVLDKTITGMSLAPGAPISGSSVTVDPVTVTGDPGLKFVTNLTTTVGTATATIFFTINAPSSNPMTDASLAVAGTLNSTRAGFSVTETLNPPFGTSFEASDTSLTASTTFAPTTSLNVQDLLLAARAELTSFENQFSETPVTTPEPSSLALLGVGLSALALRRRPKRA